MSEPLKSAAFEYFYWYSRFEFALKENGFLKTKTPGRKAEPDWTKFQNDNHHKYKLSTEARQLVDLRPKRQIISQTGSLEWAPVGTDHCQHDLCCVVTSLKTVRNNLFHGGKHYQNEPYYTERDVQLLQKSKKVLDQLAQLAAIEHDYSGIY